MSLLRDFNFREVSSFGGAWLLPDPSMVDIRGALLSRNVEFNAGQVGTRTGYKPFTLPGLVAPNIYTASQMYIWYAPFSALSSSYSDSVLVTFTSSGSGGVPMVNGQLLVGGAGAALGFPGEAAVSATFVSAGMRLFCVYHDANQRGVACANSSGSQAGYFAVVPTGGGSYGGFVGTHFPPPLRTVPTTSEPGAGVVTAGVHRIGYVLEHLSGFVGRAAPDSGSTSPPSITSFAPVSVTASGSKNLSVTINPGTFPADSAAISIIMTTTGNVNQYYFVPGSRTAVNYTSTTVTITVNISDGDLTSQGIDATPNLYWLTCNSSATTTAIGTPPFSPAHLCLFGDRMAFKGYQTDSSGNTVDCLYVSERNNYQSITADQHVLQLPGQRVITTMFQMAGNYYIVGPHEIYSVTDTGDVPVSWPAPHLVDGRTGTLAIHGVEVSPSGQYAWIADQAGLFLFQGSPISSLPVSYYQSNDWARINWGAAYTVQIKDDASRQRLYILVPLDGATSPTHLMVFDYTDGPSYLTVRYSLDSISGYNMGAIELVRNDLSGQATGNQKIVELWVGPRTGTTYLRKASTADTTPYRDVTSTAIASTYRTCPLPGRDATNGLIQMHHGFHARIKGAGSITPTLYDIDAARSFACRTATLAAAPDLDTLFLAEMRGELAFVEFATNTVDTHWQLAYLKYYSSPYISQR